MNEWELELRPARRTAESDLPSAPYDSVELADVMAMFQAIRDQLATLTRSVEMTTARLERLEGALGLRPSSDDLLAKIATRRLRTARTRREISADELEPTDGAELTGTETADGDATGAE